MGLEKDIPIKLTHFGEVIVSDWIQSNAHQFFKLCGRENSEVHGGKVFYEVALKPHSGKGWDGTSRVDVVVPICEGLALPVEVKLGKHGLSKKVVDGWLSGPPCDGTSHKGKRWAGKMMWILDQFIKDSSVGDLITKDSGYRLTPEWYAVVRRSVANAWKKSWPNFKRAKVIVFEELVPEARANEFDEMVRRRLPASYYEAWLREYV